MREIAKADKKSNKLLSQIRKNITHLIELNDSNHKDAKKLKGIIDEIHYELNKYKSIETDENNQILPDKSFKKLKKEKNLKSNIDLKNLMTQNNTEMDYERKSQKEELKYLDVPRKIVVKRISRRRSFLGWLFNNMDI